MCIRETWRGDMITEDNFIKLTDIDTKNLFVDEEKQ